MQIEVLIKKAKLGDKEALVKLIMLKQQEYYKLAYVYMKNEADALDALEDMIVILYENISSLKNEGSFYSWSKTILVNRCKKILKEKSKVILVDTFQEKGCESDINQKEDQLLLEKELSKLSEKHMEVIKLRYFLDLDYETIGNILKIPLGTVKSRISVGINKLKESLGGDINERY